MAWRADINNLSTGEPIAYIILSDESQRDGGYLVFKFNSNDEVLFGDDYYLSLKEAKFHCGESYQIANEAWYECPNPDWSSIKSAQDQ